jgi:CheY-like chemotaxis protein
MDAETRARIFEPFFTTKEKGRGTGLGLSTVYGIVKQSGGYIWVDTEPGLGAGVKIYLPRVDLEVSRIQPTDLPRSLSGKETILLVEDEEAVRRLTSSVLSRHGYTVLEACNGEEAMRIAAEGDGGIDLVLTDGVMPGMAVGDLVAGIRSARPQATILVMSGYTGEAIIRRGILELDIPFLEKPFTSTALLRKVRDVLDAQEVEFVPRELHSP